jgi:hypothetical protein
LKAALVALLLLATPEGSEAERRSMALLAAGDKAFDNLEYEEAAKRYLEAYRLLEAAGERNRAPFLYNAGLAYEQLGSCEKAVVLFDRYLETEQMSVTREIAGTIDRARRCAPTIRIQTNPPGASVLIDGVSVGASPLSVPVRAGEHVLRFEMDGYRSLETALNVEEGRPRAVVESLAGRAKLGRIDLVVRDISEVSIDDEVIGRGPFERQVKIAHGKHDVRLNRLGCELRELELNVPPGGSVEAAFSPDCVAVPAQEPPHGPYVRGRGGSNAPAWISGGIGVAALAVSGVFVGLSIDGRNAVDAELAKPDDVRVGAEVRRLNDDVGRNNVVAVSAGVAGLAALSLAVVLWVTSPEPLEATVAGPTARF